MLCHRGTIAKEAAMSRVISTAMPVGEIVTRKPIWVDRDTTILGASNLMRCYEVGELVVTDELKDILVPVGIVSARDIVTRIIATRLDPTVLTAGDITWLGSNGCKVTDTVSETLQLLQTTRSNVLPVIDGDGGLTGVVSLDDLLWALAKK
jgi:CBS domain-containing protein